MPEKRLGLDIGDSSIKAVQVEGGLKGYRVVSCAVVPNDPDRSLEENLAAFFENFSIDGAGCCTSIQTHLISFRNLTMPFKDRKKIAQTIGFELEPMLPFPVEAIATDYILPENTTETKILSASIHVDRLQEHLGALAIHNLDPDVVDIAGVATITQLEKRGVEPSNTLFVDIGSQTSTIILLIADAVVLVRSLHFGGDTLTQAIATARKINRQDAEALKRQPGANGLAQLINPVVGSFCQSIRHTLHAFRYEVMREAYPEKMILTGGGALFSGLKNTMAERLELPVETLDLARDAGLTFDKDVSGDWNPLVMNGALALALREPKNKNGFNFRIDRFQKVRKYQQLKGEVKRIAIYGAAILLALLGRYFADYYVLKKQHDYFQAQIHSIFKQTFPEVQRVVDPVHQMKVKIREAKEATLLPTESLIQRTAVDVLRDVALRIPKTANVDLSSLVIDEERIRLKGLTDNFNTVDEIKNGLQGSSYFKDVSIASAQLDRTENKIRFEMIMGHK